MIRTIVIEKAPLDAGSFFCHLRLVFRLLPILLDAICIAHIIRTGRDRIWIYAVVFVPLAGALAYIAVEMLPDLLRGYRARRFMSGAMRAVDPERGLRRRAGALHVADTVQNRLKLAEEQMNLGHVEQAAALYAEAATGLYADDTALLMGLARASYKLDRPAEALAALDRLRAADPRFQSHEAHAIYAGSLAALGRDAEALEEYAALAPAAPGEEARFRYAALLDKTGRRDEAQTLYREILDRSRHAPGRYRRAQAKWIGLARERLES